VRKKGWGRKETVNGEEIQRGKKGGVEPRKLSLVDIKKSTGTNFKEVNEKKTGKKKQGKGAGGGELFVSWKD